eukprot:scaffold8869_cov27-Phaeocystis_antarctica.AAC.1
MKAIRAGCHHAIRLDDCSEHGFGEGRAELKTTVSRLLSNQPKLRMDVLIGMGPSNWDVT